ncbi:Flagellar hook-associated protein 2 [compost metagenome]
MTRTDLATAITNSGGGYTGAIATNRLRVTGADAEAFTITGSTAALRTWAGIGTVTTTAGVQARARIGGVDRFSNDNVFTAAESGIAGVGFTVVATSAAGATLNITNRTGTLAITNQATSTTTNVAITAAMTTAADVAAAINAANTGMTATVNGSGRLELKGNTAGVAFTVADAGGGTALASWLGINSVTNQVQAADLARMTVNGGPTVTSSTNQFTGAITGVTINALAPGAATLDITNGSGTLRITNTTAGGFTDVSIASGSGIAAVASAINAANTGMTASVQAGRLVLTGNTEGDAFTIEDAGGGSTFASSLGIDTSQTTQFASLASISLDGGPAITGTSNTFNGAIAGVSIQALAAGTTTLTVTAGSGPTSGGGDAQKQLTLNAVKELVTSFNDTMKFIKDNSNYDTATKKAGLLLGDSMAANLRSGLTRMFNEVVDDQGVYRTAHSVGIQLQRDGTLALDEARLKQALEDDSAAFKTLFTHEDGLSWTDGYGVAIKSNTLGATGSTVAGDGIANRLKAYVDTMVANASQYNSTDGTGRHARGTLLTRIDSAESVIKETDRRIESYLNRLAKRQKVMEAKFAAMEKVVTMMRNQGNYMASQYMGMAQNNQ